MDRGQRLDVVSIDRANRGRPSRGRRCDRSLSDAERPPAPAVEPDPELEPVDPGSTTLAAEPSTQPPNNDPAANVDPEPPPEPEVPPDIPGEQIPYNPAFSSSPAIPDEAFNAFLIIGTDKGGRRADVIILALLPEDGSAPILVSLPRDLWLQIPCWEKPNRINAALNGCGSAASGPELLALTVAEFTGIQPDHFALFSFDDFTRVIDAFGGIEICVEYPVRDGGGLDLPAGCTKADGDTALGWVRSRKTKEFRDGQWRFMQGVNDLTRNERQRDLLLQLLGKVKSMNTLTSLVDIVQSIADAVTIDDGISIGGAIGLAWDLREVSPGGIIQVTISVRHHRTESGAQVLLPKMPFAEVFAEVWPAAD